MNDFVWQSWLSMLVLLHVALIALVFGLHFAIRLLGFHYTQIMDKMDNDPKAIAIFLGAVALAYAHLVGSVLH